MSGCCGVLRPPHWKIWGIPTVVSTEKRDTAAELRKLKPWTGKAETKDIVLAILPFAVMIVMLAFRPFQPFLIAEHPILVSIITGGTLSIGAGGAMAYDGDTSLIPVIIGGTIGVIKFAWIYWWIGRRWGYKVIHLIAPTDGMKAAIFRIRHKRWISYLMLCCTRFPGVPTSIVYFASGWHKIPLWIFYIIVTIVSAMWVTLIASLAYTIGEPAVEAVMLIDRYALWVSMGIIVITVFISTYRQEHQRKKKQAEKDARKEARQQRAEKNRPAEEQPTSV